MNKKALWLILSVIFILLACVLGVYIMRRPQKNEIYHEFLGYLKERVPAIKVVSSDETRIVFKLQGQMEHTLTLEQIYHQVSEAGRYDVAARREIYENFVQGVLEWAETFPDRFEDAKSRIFPRLVSEAYYTTLGNRSQPDGKIQGEPLQKTGLFIVYVLDHKHSMKYLMEKHVHQFGTTWEKVHETALENLRHTFDGKPVRDVFKKHNITSVKMMDGYDAARILLIPEYLEEGESIVALIPDDNILTLTEMPENADGGNLIKLAGSADGRPLLNRPVIVTKRALP